MHFSSLHFPPLRFSSFSLFNDSLFLCGCFWLLPSRTGCAPTRNSPPPSPCGVGDVDPSQVDALAANDEQGGEAEQRHAAADHRQLGRLASSQLQLLDDVAAQDDAHAGAGHDNHTWGGRESQSYSSSANSCFHLFRSQLFTLPTNERLWVIQLFCC